MTPPILRALAKYGDRPLGSATRLISPERRVVKELRRLAQLKKETPTTRMKRSNAGNARRA